MTWTGFGKMEWILLAIGLVVGGGTGFGITWKLVSKSQTEAPQVIVVEDKTAEKQQDVIMQLTDLDLVKPVCDPTFIQTQKSDLLCREWICRMMQRGIDAKTSQTDCNEIANVSNKIAIHSFCAQTAKKEDQTIDTDKHKACIEFFDRRI